MASLRSRYTSVTLPVTWERTLRMGWWCTARAIVIPLGSARSGMEHLALGALVGGLVGHLGTIGASIMVFAGDAVMAGLAGGVVIPRLHGGGHAELGHLAADQLHGAEAIPPTQQAMCIGASGQKMELPGRELLASNSYEGTVARTTP